MAEEDAVFDRDTFTDKRVTGNLAIVADRGVLLNLDKRTNLGVVTHGASVHVDEF
jgi:hypothetical protein